MAATNRTPSKLLPQFVETDKPTWLGDVNGAFAKIDDAFVTDESVAATANVNILALQTALAALTLRIHNLDGL